MQTVIQCQVPYHTPFLIKGWHLGGPSGCNLTCEPVATKQSLACNPEIFKPWDLVCGSGRREKIIPRVASCLWSSEKSPFHFNFISWYILSGGFIPSLLRFDCIRILLLWHWSLCICVDAGFCFSRNSFKVLRSDQNAHFYSRAYEDKQWL